MLIALRRATEADAITLTLDLRLDDLAEVVAAHGVVNPLTIIAQGIAEGAECWAMFFGARLAAVWGVTLARAEALTGRRLGSAWLLGTSEVERHPRVFWRACLLYLPALLDRWDVLTNYIDARHERAIRWSERLGFRLDPPAPHGPLGFPFQRFTITPEELRCARPLSFRQ